MFLLFTKLVLFSPDAHAADSPKQFRLDAGLRVNQLSMANSSDVKWQLEGVQPFAAMDFKAAYFFGNAFGLASFHRSPSYANINNGAAAFTFQEFGAGIGYRFNAGSIGIEPTLSITSRAMLISGDANYLAQSTAYNAYLGIRVPISELLDLHFDAGYGSSTNLMVDSALTGITGGVYGSAGIGLKFGPKTAPSPQISKKNSNVDKASDDLDDLDDIDGLSDDGSDDSTRREGRSNEKPSTSSLEDLDDLSDKDGDDSDELRNKSDAAMDDLDDELANLDEEPDAAENPNDTADMSDTEEPEDSENLDEAKRRVTQPALKPSPKKLRKKRTYKCKYAQGYEKLRFVALDVMEIKVAGIKYNLKDSKERYRIMNDLTDCEMPMEKLIAQMGFFEKRSWNTNSTNIKPIIKQAFKRIEGQYNRDKRRYQSIESSCLSFDEKYSEDHTDNCKSAMNFAKRDTNPWFDEFAKSASTLPTRALNKINSRYAEKAQQCSESSKEKIEDSENATDILETCESAQTLYENWTQSKAALNIQTVASEKNPTLLDFKTAHSPEAIDNLKSTIQKLAEKEEQARKAQLAREERARKAELARAERERKKAERAEKARRAREKKLVKKYVKKAKNWALKRASMYGRVQQYKVCDSGMSEYHYIYGIIVQFRGKEMLIKVKLDKSKPSQGSIVRLGPTAITTFSRRMGGYNHDCGRVVNGNLRRGWRPFY